MAIPVVAAGDPAPAGSLLQDAYAATVAGVEPVWERLAIQVGRGPLTHLAFAGGWTPARARAARLLGREDSELGPAADSLLACVRTAVIAERRAYAEGLIATAELARAIEVHRCFEGSGEAVPRRPLVAAEYTAQVLAFELGISTSAAMDRLGRAWALTRLPRTLAAVHAGWLGIGAANALLAATAGVDPEHLDAVEARVFDVLGANRLPDGTQPLGSWTPEQLTDLAQAHPRLALDLDTTATPAWMRARARTAIKLHDPAALRRQVKAARSKRGVRIWDADQPGMAWLALLGTAAEVAACMRRIDTEAIARHRSLEAQDLVDPDTGQLPTLDNTRADVTVDLLLGPRPDGIPGPPINLTVHVVPGPDDQPNPDDGPRGNSPHGDSPDGDSPDAPASDAPGPDHDGPGSGSEDDPDGDGQQRPGAGGLPAGQVRVDHLGAVVRDALDELVFLAEHSAGGPATTTTGGRVTLRKTQPVSCPGHPAGFDPGPYRPSPDLAAAVIARDATCRWPGCTIPAHTCDLDHTIPWPKGPTCLCNLAALCRRHHRVKTHHLSWHLTNHGTTGRLTWTTPTGRTIDTHPGRGSPGGPNP